MIIYKRKVQTLNVEDLVICDICKSEYRHIVDIQEFTHIHNICGYDSVFYDGAEIELDICQHCLKKQLGKYIEERWKEEQSEEDQNAE